MLHNIQIAYRSTSSVTCHNYAFLLLPAQISHGSISKTILTNMIGWPLQFNLLLDTEEFDKVEQYTVCTAGVSSQLTHNELLNCRSDELAWMIYCLFLCNDYLLLGSTVIYHTLIMVTVLPQDVKMVARCFLFWGVEQVTISLPPQTQPFQLFPPTPSKIYNCIYNNFPALGNQAYGIFPALLIAWFMLSDGTAFTFCNLPGP